MSKKFDKILSERLKELPIHAPGEKLRADIEDALNAEDVIRLNLAGLPLHSPDAGNWDVIEASLPAAKITRSRHKLLYLSTAAAAAILLLIALPRLLSPAQDIIVESEIIQSEEWSAARSGGLENEEPLDMIRDLCQTGAPVCETASFREKMILYQELTEELRKLESVISQVGDSPEIIQSVIRIENLKSATLQELIKLIHS